MKQKGRLVFQAALFIWCALSSDVLLGKGQSCVSLEIFFISTMTKPIGYCTSGFQHGYCGIVGHCCRPAADSGD